MSKNVAEMKWTNQNLTDQRLNAWLIEHQQAMYRLLQMPNLQDLKKAVYSAQIIYFYYFRLLIFNEETKKEFDAKVKGLRKKVEQIEREMEGSDTIQLDEDIIEKIMDLISEMLIILQKGKYFFNIVVNTKDFEESLKVLKQL